MQEKSNVVKNRKGEPETRHVRHIYFCRTTAPYIRGMVGDVVLRAVRADVALRAMIIMMVTSLTLERMTIERQLCTTPYTLRISSVLWICVNDAKQEIKTRRPEIKT